MFLSIKKFRSNGKSLQQQKTAEKRNKKTEKRVKSFPNLSPTPLWMCVCGERMAWGDGEMEGKECWLGNARGRDG